ncbi:MAG: lytic transglycosylase domain-containing protein [Treponema sp.]|jgi:soluble lytic murein transglycosylase|nr:lytic transglycosylase domain-containing protein [Treponema sp.]
MEKTALFGFFFTLLFSFSSCGAEAVLDLSKKEASQRLKRGDIGFILNSEPKKMRELARIHPSAPFYAGLLVRSRQDEPRQGTAVTGSGDTARPDPRIDPLGTGGSSPEILAAALFEAALDSPAPRIREEAARELFLPVLEGKISARRILDRGPEKNNAPASGGEADSAALTLRGAALYALNSLGELRELYADREPQSSWDRALIALAGADKGRARDFLLAGPIDGACQWAFDEILNRHPTLLTEFETAAITGRFAVARSAFNEGLEQFRLALAGDPGLFFEYPDLITDLGRSFQFTPTQTEGIDLFLAWENYLAMGKVPENVPGIPNFPAGPLPGGVKGGNIRYRLLFFAARIARQRERYDQAVELFTQALPFAPDPLQEDACIWYILNISLPDNPGILPGYILRWHDDAYFADILDLFAQSLVAKRQWKTLLETFALIRSGTDGATIAKYAYIIGRAVMEGYISLGETGGAAAAEFFTIAFEEGQASLYYRSLSASYLKKRFLPLKGGKGSRKINARNFPHAPEMELLLGFFEYGAPSFAPAYVEAAADRLSIGELRALAEAQTAAGYWDEVIRLVALYMGREDYEINRRDMELYYPRPFRELIEENARNEGLPPEIFYGLIRTESAFVPNILSRVGAIGLSQLMPSTAEDMAGRIARKGGPNYGETGKIELRDPRINLHIGAVYLKYLIEYQGSPMLALLAYNGGMGRVRRWRTEEPNLPEDLFLETIEYQETREYGRRVLAAAAAYGYLYYDMSMEAVIADIFKDGL